MTKSLRGVNTNLFSLLRCSISAFGVGPKTQLALSALVAAAVAKLAERASRAFCHRTSPDHFHYTICEYICTSNFSMTVNFLFQEKRLEFIGGGWSMNDEAVCHYSSIIDNMALGFQTLQEEFGSKECLYS